MPNDVFGLNPSFNSSHNLKVVDLSLRFTLTSINKIDKRHKGHRDSLKIFQHKRNIDIWYMIYTTTQIQ